MNKTIEDYKQRINYDLFDDIQSYGNDGKDMNFKLTMMDYFNSEDIEYKFNEDVLIDEFRDYINSTYQSHYSKDKFQATEFIIDGGHGTGFCIGNVLKYAQRYGKKGSRDDARKDLLKVLHYALIQLHIHDVTEQEDCQELSEV
jgi:hypothetical protein